MQEQHTNSGVGRSRGISFVYMAVCFLAAMGCGLAAAYFGAPVPLAVGVAFFLASLSLWPIARLNYAEAPYGGPIYRVFKRVLDKNFAVGYLLLALVNGVLGGIVGYFVV